MNTKYKRHQMYQPVNTKYKSHPDIKTNKYEIQNRQIEIKSSLLLVLFLLLLSHHHHLFSREKRILQKVFPALISHIEMKCLCKHNHLSSHETSISRKNYIFNISHQHSSNNHRLSSGQKYLTERKKTFLS